MKAWYQSKTLWTGLATMCTGTGMYFNGEQSLESLTLIAVGVIFTILRVVTKKKLVV